jgi:PAS fold
MMKKHVEMVIKLGAMMLFNNANKDVIQLGEHMTETGTDDETEAGFWIWDVRGNEKMYYSPKLVHELGYDYDTWEHVEGSFMKYMLPIDLKASITKTKEMIEQKEHDPFVNIVNYKCADGSIKAFNCSGSIIFDKEDNPIFIIGTHKFYK